MTHEEYAPIVERLQTYESQDALKDLIRRHGRVLVERVALERLPSLPADRARIQADLRRAADDIDAEEMTL